MQIIYTSQFVKRYKKLPSTIQDQAEEKEKLFRINPFDPKLKSHKLHGNMSSLWSFSVNHSIRVIFEIAPHDTFYFHLIGNHDIYD